MLSDDIPILELLNLASNIDQQTTQELKIILELLEKYDDDKDHLVDEPLSDRHSNVIKTVTASPMLGGQQDSQMSPQQLFIAG